MVVDPAIYVGANTVASAVRRSLPKGKDPLRDLTLEQLVRKCFKLADANWMAGTDDLLFRSGVGGAILLTDDAGRHTLQESMKAVNALNTILTGIPVDPAYLDEMAKRQETGEILPLVKWFREEREQKK